MRTHAHEAGAEVWWWGLFAAGGMISALIGPVLMLLQGVAGPAGLPTAAMRYDRMRHVVSNPLLKLAFLLFSVFSFIYSGHRIRRYLPDLGVRNKSPLINWLCYGGALLGGLKAALVIARIPGKER
jgi:fumarate reductase subunit D